MKTTFRHDKNYEPRSTRVVRVSFSLLVGLLFFVAIFYLSTAALSGAGVVIGWGVYIPGVQNIYKWFESKQMLIAENKLLLERTEWLEDEVRIAGVALRENRELKSMLSRKDDDESLVLGTVIAHPNISPYDTLLIDVGSTSGLSVGDLVFGLPYSALGTVLSLEAKLATVGLFSAPNRETPVLVGEAELPGLLVGRGGGNFRIDLPKDANVITGDLVVLAHDTRRVVGVVGTIEPGKDSSSISLLVTYPLNIFTISRVFVAAKTDR